MDRRREEKRGKGRGRRGKEEGLGEEGEEDYKPSKPTANDVLPPTELKVPQPPKQHHQMFKFINFWETFLIQTNTAYDTIAEYFTSPLRL